MAIFLALAAGLLAVSVTSRIVRLALVLVLVALVVAAVGGHGPDTLGHLARLL